MKHIVGFSGGIDSQACARWVLNRFPAEDVILLNSNAGGNEHKLTEAFKREYSAKVFPLTEVFPVVSDNWKTPGFAEKKGLDGNEPLTFLRMIEIQHRPPARNAQFCTEILKLRPMKRWHDANLQDVEFEVYRGVRRDESEKRKNTPFREWDDYFDCYTNSPLADWTKQMCFDYVKAHGEPINPLYSLGFERVGCAPCGVGSSKDQIRAWADRFPERIDELDAWEQKSELTYFPPIVPWKRAGFNTVREVVEWSRTDRGGRQFNILNTLERPSCESKFGLCE